MLIRPKEKYKTEVFLYFRHRPTSNFSLLIIVFCIAFDFLLKVPTSQMTKNKHQADAFMYVAAPRL